MKGIRILILDYASGQAKVQRILLIHTMSASAALQANGIHYDSVLPNKLVYQNKCTTQKILIKSPLKQEIVTNGIKLMRKYFVKILELGTEIANT